MANCFDNLISIRGACTETTATLEMYLDDFGVTLTECESYVTKTYPSAEDFALNKISSAGKMLSSEIQRSFMGKMRTTPLIENNRAGHYLTDMQSDALLNATMKGIEFTFYSKSSFVDLYVDFIELFTDFTGTIDVKVYDLYQNKLVDTITVTCVANQISRKTVGKKYPSYRHDMNLIFVYDASTIGSFKTTTNSTYCSSCEGANYWVDCNSYTRARGVQVGTATNKIAENMNGVGYTGGLSVGYSINCNYDLWLCSVGQMLVMPLIYKSCALIMFAALNETDRINSRTTINREQAQRKFDWFETAYREQMEMILPNIKIPTDNLCFECNNRIKTRIALP